MDAEPPSYDTLHASDDVMVDEEELIPATVEDSRAPPLPQREYELGQVFKTSNRIVDDIKSDMFFIKGDNGFRGGILGVNAVEYAERLSQLKHRHGDRFKLLMLNDFDRSVDKHIAVDAMDVITSVMAVVMETATPESISKIATYHVNFLVKAKRSVRPCKKHRFYKLEDKDLRPEDRDDLLLNFSGELSDTDKQFLPEIVDSATFFCPTCHRMLRVELFPPEFKSLEGFETEAILERFQAYKEEHPGTELAVPNQVDCLQKLYRLLRQLYSFKTPQESIELLELFIGRDLLVESLKFVVGEDGLLSAPTRPESDTQREFLLDSYLRKCVEVINMGRFFSNSTPEFQIRSGLAPTALLQAFEEFDTHLMASIVADVEDQSLKSKDYISLCSQIYFKDQFIIDTYKELCFANPASRSKYLDSLSNIANDRGSPTLWTELVTQKSLGVVGFEELRNCYAMFDIDVDAPDFETTVDDSYLMRSYRYFSTYRNDPQYWDAMMTIAQDRGSEHLQRFLKAEPLADVGRAYSTLDINDTVEDDIVVTAYEIKKDDFPANEELFDRCFLAIAIARKSMRLFDYVDNYIGHLNDLLPDVGQNLDGAYRVIGCPPTTDDFTFLSCFQEKWNTNNDPRMLYRCLKSISEVRRSKLVESFAASGIIDARYLPLANTPCGLNNIGNTCYLNSLLQYYFVVEPLRSAIISFNYSLTQEQFDGDELFSKRRIGGRTVSYKETERSIQFVYQLQDLYRNLITSKKRYVTPTRELAYLAFSPSTEEVEFENDTETKVTEEDLNVPNLIDLTSEDEKMDVDKASPAPEDLEPDDTTSTPDTVDVAPQLPVEPEKESEEPVAPVEKKRGAAKIDPEQLENALEMGRQQDVTECIENVLFQMESAFRPLALDSDDEQVDIIKQLFYGKTKQILQPVDAVTKEPVPDGSVRTKEERFLSLLVNIGDHPKDIYDALDTYFTEDLMELDDGEVKRSLTITELPKILQIQIQRVQYDRERCMPFKSIEPLPFDEKLYMDRYMETDDAEIIQKRKQVFDWKREMRQLSQRKSALASKNASGLTALQALEVSKAYLESDVLKANDIFVDPNTIAVLDDQIKSLSSELVTIDESLEALGSNCVNQFKDLKKVGYSIFAIFIHRGEASYGHYWIYIRDPKRDVYRKYNDEIVSEVTFSEVMNFAEGNTATPYFLVFVRDDLENYVDPLKRELAE